jgi:hypothetical protein
MYWQLGKPFILISSITTIPMFLNLAIADDIFGECAAEIEAINTQQDKSERSVVKNKIKLLDAIVHGSSTAKRIEKSNNSDAVELLENARTSLQHSNKLYAQGCVEVAERELNKGLKAIETASRVAVNNKRMDKIERQRYENLSNEVSSFREAYDRILKEKKGEADDILDTDAMDDLLRTAGKLAQADDYKQANETMLKAANMIASALVFIRDQETLRYEFKFESIEEEFAYVMKTNQSYTKLLDMVLANKDLSTSVRKSIEKLVKRNEKLRAEADVKLSAGNKEAAIASLNEGTENMIRALRYTGIGL